MMSSVCVYGFMTSSVCVYGFMTSSAGGISPLRCLHRSGRVVAGGTLDNDTATVWPEAFGCVGGQQL